jgi:hypothetical protein
MRAWVEVPDEWGWGPTRILRMALKRAGYWTEEWRGVRGKMIWVTGAKINETPVPPDHRPDTW